MTTRDLFLASEARRSRQYETAISFCIAEPQPILVAIVLTDIFVWWGLYERIPTCLSSAAGRRTDFQAEPDPALPDALNGGGYPGS